MKTSGAEPAFVGANASALKDTFFQRDTLLVAEELIGTMLCRRLPDGRVSRHRIEETEAYDGPHDKACHAHKGRTARTEVMFAPGGVWYVYLCYGVHWMLNVVTGPRDYPAAVLIRGASPHSGPGRLTRALAIDKSLNAQPASTTSSLWIERGSPVRPHCIARLPRIGVAYAGPDWADKPYRFVLAGTGENE